MFGRLVLAESSMSAGGFCARLSIACLPVIERPRTWIGHAAQAFDSLRSSPDDETISCKKSSASAAVVDGISTTALPGTVDMQPLAHIVAMASNGSHLNPLPGPVSGGPYGRRAHTLASCMLPG